MEEGGRASSWCTVLYITYSIYIIQFIICYIQVIINGLLCWKFLLENIADFYVCWFISCFPFV